MTVRIGDMTFSDWVSLPFQDGWTDTFIFRISTQACIPPFDYAPLLKRVVAPTTRKRSSSSIWVQVDPPGDWFIAEVRRSLHGLALPYAVTRAGDELKYLDFSRPPTLLHTPSQHPPIMDESAQLVSPPELRCLQALGRMQKGNEHEIAALSGIPIDITKTHLHNLAERKLVVHKTSQRIRRDKSKPAQLDLFPLCHSTLQRLSLPFLTCRPP